MPKGKGSERHSEGLGSQTRPSEALAGVRAVKKGGPLRLWLDLVEMHFYEPGQKEGEELQSEFAKDFASNFWAAVKAQDTTVMSATPTLDFAELNKRASCIEIDVEVKIERSPEELQLAIREVVSRLIVTPHAPATLLPDVAPARRPFEISMRLTGPEKPWLASSEVSERGILHLLGRVLEFAKGDPSLIPNVIPVLEQLLATLRALRGAGPLTPTPAAEASGLVLMSPTEPATGQQDDLKLKEEKAPGLRPSLRDLAVELGDKVSSEIADFLAEVTRQVDAPAQRREVENALAAELIAGLPGAFRDRVTQAVRANPNPDRNIDRKGAAAILGLSEVRIRQFAAEERIGAKMVDGEYRFTRQELEDFKKEERPTGRPPKSSSDPSSEE